MVSFIWGGNTGIATPEELAHRRRAARDMIRSSTEQVAQDPWQGLAQIARAISGNYADYKAGQEENKQRGAADERFGALFQPRSAATASAGDTAKVTPISYSPGERTGAPGLPGIAKAWLETVAGPESAGQYDVLYGGTKFADMSDHPHASMDITSGPNKGKKTTAAGKYQFLAPTWDEQKTRLNLPDFSPGSQDAAAWNLSKETYKAKTGRDLETDLAGADDAGLQKIADLMSGTWTSLPGGIEQGIDGQGFVDQFRKNQGAGAATASTAQPVRLAQAGGPNLNQLLQAYSDPWMSEGQRDVLKVYIDQALKNADPKTQLDITKLQKEIGKLDKSGGGKLGLNPQTGVDANRNPDGVTLSKKPIKLDAGTHFVLLDPGTRQPVGTIPKDVAGEAQARADGKSMSDLEASLPKVQASMKLLDGQWDLVDRTIDEAVTAIDDGWIPRTGFVGALASAVPGSPQYDLARKLETIKANIGFDKLQSMREASPTGGALGQVSDFENRLLQAIQGSMEQGQSADQLKANLAEIKSMLSILRREKRNAFQQTYGGLLGNPPDASGGGGAPDPLGIR